MFFFYISPGTGSSIPPGILAAIIICSLLALALIFLLVYYFAKNNKRKPQSFQRPRTQRPPPFNPQGDSIVDNRVSGQQSNSGPPPQPTICQARQPGRPPKKPAVLSSHQPITSMVTMNQSHAPVQRKLQHGKSNPGRMQIGQRLHQKSANVPREAILNENYLPPFNQPLTRPVPSAPSLDHLDRIQEAPSRVDDNIYRPTCSLGSLNMHHRSLPNLYDQSSFQVVRYRDDHTNSHQNITGDSQYNNMVRNSDLLVRPGSVSLGVNSEMAKFSAPGPLDYVPPHQGQLMGITNYGYHLHGEIDV